MAEAANGHMSVHKADIREFDIPAALPKALPVPWQSDGEFIVYR